MPSLRTTSQTTTTAQHPQPTTETQRFKRGVVFSLVRYGILVTSGFGYTFLGARLLGPEIMGVVALLTSILGIFRPVSSLGEQFALVPALNRYPDKDPQAVALFTATVVLSALTTLVLSLPFAWVTGLILSEVYHRPDLMTPLWVYLIGFYSIYNLVLLASAPFQARQEMRLYAFAELVTGLTRIGLLVILIMVFGATPMAAIGSQVIAFTVSFGVLALLLPKVFPLVRGPFSRNKLIEDLKGVYAFSLKSMPANASISVLQHADRLIIGFFTTPYFLGIYAVAYGIFEKILMMGTNYENMVFASTSRLAAQQQPDMIAVIYRSALRTSFFWLLPLVILIAGFAYPILWLFGNAFTQGEATLVILIVGVLFDNFARITTGLLAGLNQPGLKTVFVVCGAAANLVLNLVLIPPYGIMGAALANSLGYLVSTVLCGLWIAGPCPLNIWERDFVRQLLLLATINGLLLVAVLILRHWALSHPLAVGCAGAALLLLYYQAGRLWILTSPPQSSPAPSTASP